MSEFRLGIKAKAHDLGVSVVGEPFTEEIYIDTEISYQVTTKGEFRYYKEPNIVHFFRAAGT